MPAAWHSAPSRRDDREALQKWGKSFRLQLRWVGGVGASAQGQRQPRRPAGREQRRHIDEHHAKAAGHHRHRRPQQGLDQGGFDGVLRTLTAVWMSGVGLKVLVVLSPGHLGIPQRTDTYHDGRPQQQQRPCLVNATPWASPRPTRTRRTGRTTCAYTWQRVCFSSKTRVRGQWGSPWPSPVTRGPYAHRLLPARRIWASSGNVVIIVLTHSTIRRRADQGYHRVRSAGQGPHVDVGEHFSGGQHTADRLKSGPAWWAGCRWFYQ